MRGADQASCEAFCLARKARSLALGVGYLSGGVESVARKAFCLAVGGGELRALAFCLACGVPGLACVHGRRRDASLKSEARSTTGQRKLSTPSCL